LSPRRTDAYVLSFERFEFLLKKLEMPQQKIKAARFTKTIRKTIKNEEKKKM